MTKDNLSERIENTDNLYFPEHVLAVGDVKEKIQNTQRRLKEEIEFRKQFGQISIAEIEIINEIIKEIFLKEFGDKLLK